MDEGDEFKIGRSFDCYDDLQSFVNHYQDAKFCKFWKREAITIESSLVKGYIKPELKYTYLKYTCIFGGQNFRPKGKGKRQTKTFKKDNLCPAFLCFGLSPNRTTLVFKRYLEQHNHELSKASYQYLPQHRKLSESIKSTAVELLQLRANKKFIQKKLQAESGKIITLRDISNLKKNVKTDNLQKCLDLLQQEYQADIVLNIDDMKNFKGLFFQTPSMKRTLHAFPEFISIDATYRLLKVGIPVFLIVVEDGNCQTEIVAVSLLVKEDRESFTWFLKIFKEKNECWKNTKCIMTDKDLLERDIIKDNFPDANIILCIFHSMKSFSREITCEKMGITQGQRVLALEILQALVYAKTQNEFQKLVEQLKTNAPIKIYLYFEKNWLPIKDEWSMSHNYFKGSFLNTTNNRIESINSKLKQTINKNSSLEEFIHSLFTIICSLQQERDYKAHYQQEKRLVNTTFSQADLQYNDLLTYEAAGKVRHQIIRSNSIILDNVDCSSCAVLEIGEGSVTVTNTTCTCNFFAAMMLPCRHIFAFRKKKGIPIFDGELCNIRWTKDYYRQNQRTLRTDFRDDNPEVNLTNISIDFSKPKHTILSYTEKRRKALIETNVMADLIASSSNMLYLQRLKNIDDLISCWKNNIYVRILPVTEDDEPAELVQPETLIASTDDETADNLNIECIHTDVEADVPLQNIQTEDLLEEESITIIDINSIDVQSEKCNRYSNSFLNTAKVLQDNQETYFYNEHSYCATMTTSNVFEVPLQSPSQSINIQVQNDSSVTPSNIFKENAANSSILNDIKMPEWIRKRGRPRGSDMTVIGIPKKKRGTKCFKDLPFVEKQMVMLKWLVKEEIAKSAISKNGSSLIAEEHILEVIPHSFLDQHVNISLLRNFFTDMAWRKLMQKVEEIRELTQLCKVCDMDLAYGDSIICDGCLIWYHLKCTTLKKAPKEKKWYCTLCKTL